MSEIKVSKEIAGRTMTLSTGKIARQSHGAVMAQYGETVVLVAVLASPPTREIDFFPLYLDYREATYSAGKIPGGFFKREGRPSTKEVLTMRMIDRPIRPLFPKDYRNEVQVQCMVLSSDGENDPDLIAMIGASAALSISHAPFDGPIGAARIGNVDGELVVFPTYDQVADSDMDLVVAGPREGINMIELEGQIISDDLVAAGTELGFSVMNDVMDLVDELSSQVEVEKIYEPMAVPEELMTLVADKCGDKIKEYKQIAAKTERSDALKVLRDEFIAELCPEDTDSDEWTYTTGQIKEAFFKTEGKVQRKLILAGTRIDGRQPDELRALNSEVDILPRTHGSAIFQRGETQALVTATLGTPRDMPIIDGLCDEYKKPFFMHYNFPPFSTGEIKPLRGPSRRDIGHGELAEKSLRAVMPATDQFPYTVRLVADLMESNGSTSQAATTGGSLALMAAGVPIKAPVAGISIGMVSDEDQFILLTDIVGEEDFHGDMDFKVAGTKDGITGIQLDMKARGISQDRIVATLKQAYKARCEIIDSIESAIPTPREELSEYAPRMVSIKIDPAKIGKIIGPGGKMIKKIQEETGASIDIEEDGTVFIASAGGGAEAARDFIARLTEEVELGKVYPGTVVSIREFGAFLEVLPGTEALCHVSELSMEYVNDPAEVCKMGDVMDVKVIGIDDQGKVKVSRKAVIDPDWQPPAPRERRGGGGDRGRGGDRRGGGAPRGEGGPKKFVKRKRRED
ncbi:MAG: polyribonucleotide nucleotidyltransferase [Phycisphaerales bacterium]|jgi:polyribonucleotide nucleotidyltransferase|nr:polyribonucleotide nucleotidyltransferase [Phycisphaerales bacterium]MBT7170297.1 polyribonucleotide nucleotidyltransferase [Phycisphaerales bacterium]